MRVTGVKEVRGSLAAITKEIDLATLKALKATQALAKSSIKAGLRGRPRWDHRGASGRTGDTVSLNLSPHHVSKSGGPGRLTGTLSRGVGGVRRPKPLPGGGFQGGVGVGAGVRNLYKKRLEGQYPYFKPGLRKAEPKMAAVWNTAWAKATR
ncbi:hypothetical protein RVR_10569 [Actinacidiphila reveromycinica]|uniref:HK97 gp10 family phage protein n=1 Tax=Actinacidiphila reveromycinica TaxID=659352 RepID=A0A7U3UXG6_9ACTN|nr:hypothetical protein RVR_7700 [Streptomyces sp. SN-593]BBB00623.1 hypothetical protein RVR_10569 [Streptomyces sp. SN-593]